MTEQVEQKATQGVTEQAAANDATCEHDGAQNQSGQQQRVLYGDDAIRYQNQVIQSQKNDFARLNAVNNALQQRINSILAVMLNMCSCKAPAYINRVIQETNGLRSENQRLKTQLAECDFQIAALQAQLGGKKIEIDQVD